MVIDNKIIAAIGKAQRFLMSQQHADGSWKIEEIKHKEPSFYQTPLVLTSQCMQTLLFSLNYENISAVSKALHFCLVEDIGDKDPIDLCAWKLLALQFSNTPLYAQEQKKLSERIAKEQSSEGCWRTFPSTFNLTNFSCILALKNFEFQKNLDRAKTWFKEARAEDNKGWGFDDKSQTSEVSFTGNVILALLLTGEDPMCSELQQARKFLEEKQFKDGGWSSSKLTVFNKPTTYSTAVALMSLMQLSEDPFNERVEKGIKALLDAQLENGCWPLVFGEEDIDYYPNLYAVKALSYYLYLKENWGKPEYKLLKKQLKSTQHFTAMLTLQFEDKVKSEFCRIMYRSVLDSRILGITDRAVERRKEILRILGEQGEKDCAEIIDALKELPKYQELQKRSHLTQIKADVDFLRSLNVIRVTDKDKYFTTFRFI